MKELGLRPLGGTCPPEGEEMARLWLFCGAMTGFLAVVAGAFGSHALKSRLSDGMMATFEIGARYQMYHALALLAVAWIAATTWSRLADAAGWCFLGGIALFSGSLYALSLTGVRGLGAVTPFGGVALLIGWLLLAGAGLKRKG